MEALMERPPDFVPLPFRSPPGEQGMTQDGEDIRYLGQAFGLFLLVQRGEAIYAVDQHAAHERILYDQFLSAPIPRQDLLIPYPFGTDSPEEDAFLETQREALASLGIIVSRDPPDRWLIEALPSAWKTGDEETAKAILQLRQAGSNMAESWAATLACRSAVMDGAVLDRDSALAIAEKAFRLPEPRCPHGRPIWLKLELRDLLKAVRRTE
jgi:DNA mismatch repair protein MutL